MSYKYVEDIITSKRCLFLIIFTSFLCVKIIYPNPYFEVYQATFRLCVMKFFLIQVIAKDLYFFMEFFCVELSAIYLLKLCVSYV